MAASARVIDWYDARTDYLLRKYGPGPRIHFHTGYVDGPLEDSTDPQRLQRALSRSQERMLEAGVATWGEANLSGRLLDVGCGLGGSALFLAERLGARVTALTPVKRHLGIVRDFAVKAGVSERVETVQGDAHRLDGLGPFDAAYAMGASNYFDRKVWFRQLAQVLKPGGRVFIEDTFLGRPEVAKPFNDYWLSDIGTLDEYVLAAQESGFELVEAKDVSREATGFWDLNLSWSRALLASESLDAEAIAARHRSIQWQTLLRQAHVDGGAFDYLVHFRLG